MVLLARKDHRAREDTVRALAGSGVLFTEWDIETLFICGCPRELLCREDISSSDSWNQAVQKCFPAWQELPKPLDRQQPGSRPAHNGFMTAMLLLIAVAAAVPGTVLWILGAGTAAFYGIIAGALWRPVCMSYCGFQRRGSLLYGDGRTGDSSAGFCTESEPALGKEKYYPSLWDLHQ